MKNIYLLIACSLLSISACSQKKEIKLIDSQQNLWSYYRKFQIQLPNKYYFSSSIIYNEDSIKVGEVVLDNEELVTEMSGIDYIDLSMQQHGEFETEETSYTFDCFDCTFLKADSLITSSRIWYYTIDQTYYEGPDGDFGTWNAFNFTNIEKNKILLIVFYNKNLSELQVDNYKMILESIKKQ